MNLLVETHSFLWFVNADPKLSATARSRMEDPANRNYLSIVSLWEITIKVGIGKLNIGRPLPEFFAERVDGNGFLMLPVERRHLLVLATLPLYHRDPFDRLLVAQSLSEGMPLIGADAVADAYGIHRLW